MQSLTAEWPKNEVLIRAMTWMSSENTVLHESIQLVKYITSYRIPQTNIWNKLAYRQKVGSVFLRVEEMKGLGGDNCKRLLSSGIKMFYCSDGCTLCNYIQKVIYFQWLNYIVINYI